MRLPAAALLLALALPAPPASAAESQDSCVGFIDSLPAVITTQGTWCLRQDLSTTLDAGAAITIATNNVTLDCNHFKIGGLAAGADTGAVGIESSGRLNSTVRNCTIRGFYRGLRFQGDGSGHLIEGNRFEGNTWVGIQLIASQSTIRDNRLLDTGGSSVLTATAYGMLVSGDSLQILDNMISGVFTTYLENGNVAGIYFTGSGNGDVDIGGNWIQGLNEQFLGSVVGIHATNGRPLIHGNRLHAPPEGPPGQIGSTGIYCGANTGAALANQLYGFNSAVTQCQQSGNLVVAP